MEASQELQHVLWLGTGVFLLLGLMLLGLPVLYQLRLQRRKRQEDLRLLINSLEVEKQTRQQLAADIHDGMASELSAVYHMLQYIRRNPDAAPPDVLDDVCQGVQHLMEQSRALSHGLVPPALEAFGLSRALDELVNKVNQAQVIQVRLLWQADDVPTLPDNVAYNLYRIVQELLNNLSKHAPGHQCELQLNIQQNMLTLQYTDDASPFDFYNIIQQTRGIGLTNILARVRVIHGTLQQLQQSQGNCLLITCRL